MSLAFLSKCAVALLPLLVESSPLPSDITSHFQTRGRTFPHSSHVLPLKGVHRRRRSARLLSRDDATQLLNPSSERDFLVPVSLGGQTVDLLIDTGSSDTWAVSEGYTCTQGSDCGFGKAISVDGDFDVLTDATISVSYVDGSKGTGSVANSSLEVAGIEVSEQTIGLIDSLGFEGDGLMSGLIGLAFPSITSVREGNTLVPTSSIMNTIFVEGLTDPYFSLAISRDASDTGAGGYMGIGGVPDVSDSRINVTSDYGTADIILNPLFQLQDPSNYVIGVDAISVYVESRSQWAVDDNGFACVVDSGSTLSRIPDADAEYINSLFDPPAQLNSDGNYMVSCDAVAPVISVRVGGVELLINPVDLIYGEGTCYSGVQPLLADAPLAIIGDTLLRSLLAVFDWGDMQVHLASRPLYDS